MPSRVLRFAVVLLACGCHAQSAAPPAGGPDGGADAIGFDGLPPLALDFAVTGCTRYDSGSARCYGSPPLALAFSPVSSPTLTRFLWSFGDGTPDSMERAPVHTYALPGMYDVTLVGSGTAVGAASSTQHVTVAALQAGAPCDVTAQCAPGLACACGAGAGCPPAFARGICTAPCPPDGCGAGTVCAAVELPAAARAGGSGSDGGSASDGGTDARLDGSGSASDAGRDGNGDGPGAGVNGGDGGPGGQGDGGDGGGGAPTGFHGPVCLAACKQDLDCPTGLACRELAGAGPDGARWTHACFPHALGDVGDPCRDPGGALAGAACVSGTCADLGALGVCTASCGASAPCPSNAACALLGDGRALCLATCAGAGDCARDPLLACQPPGGAGGGALGFTVPDGAPGASYCAPRPCATAADCAPAGACDGAHCVAK
jgi:PKD repeat protein